MRVRPVLGTAVAAAVLGAVFSPLNPVAGATSDGYEYNDEPVEIEILAPRSDENVGIENAGFVVDLAIEYPSLTAAGFDGLQLTGPAGHADIAPLPGGFGPGADEKVPGLVVLMAGAQNPGQNFAGVFNLTMVGDRDEDSATIHDTWLVGADAFGTGPTTLTVAVVDDLDGNGVYDDAPDSIADLDGNGVIDEDDLELLGVASDVEDVDFEINPAAA
ncbi:MAG: hypothetical protein S0880_00165 [Actinomycetota bacterium]|nr:hypothetical protein [Actinomycetota bacterium]